MVASLWHCDADVQKKQLLRSRPVSETVETNIRQMRFGLDGKEGVGREVGAPATAMIEVEGCRVMAANT